MQKELFDTPIYSAHSQVYENGINLSQPEKERLQKSVNGIMELVKQVFTENPDLWMTMEDIYRRVKEKGCTKAFESVKPRISTLKKDKFIVDDRHMKKNGSQGIQIKSYKFKV